MDKLTCGCCKNGCRCFNHMDVPNGRRPQKCAPHALDEAMKEHGRRYPQSEPWAASIESDTVGGWRVEISATHFSSRLVYVVEPGPRLPGGSCVIAQ